MEGYRPQTYGESFADVYDTWYAEVSDIDATVSAVAHLLATWPHPGDRPPLVLELGIGSGRLACPVASSGVAVVGVDASAPMLALLAAREDRVPAVLGDMAALPFARVFCGVFVGFNSIFNLVTAHAQAQCFRDVASVVTPGGWFACEALVPRDDEDIPMSSIDVLSVDLDRVLLAVSQRSPANQTVAGQHIEISSAGIRLRPWLVRYTLPEELDEMAAAAGMTLVERWSDWSRLPYEPDSRQHVSVYRVS